MLRSVKDEVSQNACYSDEIREEFSKGIAIDIGDYFIKYCQDSYTILSDKGDIEKFCAVSFKELACNAQNHFPENSRLFATLVLKKMTDKLINHFKTPSQKPTGETALELTLCSKELHGLRYIGGYVIHKLHKKFKNSAKWQKTEYQHAISLLSSMRSLDADESNSLFSMINRGGMWNIVNDFE